MDENHSPTLETADPDLAKLEAHLRGALRATPMDRASAEQLTRAVILRSARTAAGDTVLRAEAPKPSSVGFDRRISTRRMWRSLWLAGAVGTGVALMFAVRREPAAPRGVSRIYTTNATQHATVTLTDGTRVMLSPNTSLQLANFGDASRTVTIDSGEAYFTVTRAAGAPFVVRAGAATARVLGTEFLVRHARDGAQVRVAVVSGKVRMAPAVRPDSSVTLSAGEVGDVRDSVARVSRIDTTESTQGLLKFRHASVATVLEMLSRWYGYQFRYDDSSMVDQRITVAISTQSSAKALAAVERVLAVNLTVVGDTVTLVPQHARPVRGSPRSRTYDMWIPMREVGR